MAYSAYEVESGTSVIAAVETYCRHLTDNGAFTSVSTPSLTQVERFIDQTYYELQAALAREGYATAVSGTAPLGMLEHLNTVGAVAKVELSHPITGFRGEENDRYKTFVRMWKQGTAIIATDALEKLGVDRTTELGAYVEVGGTSVSRKDSIYDDADLVRARFRRGQFGNPAVADERPSRQTQGTV